MGAPSSIRKRGDDSFSLSCLSSPDSDRQANLHISKKPRSLSMHVSPNQPVSPVSLQRSVSRILQYPEPTQHLRREIHAPCRKPKFLSANLGREPCRSEMGNILIRKYDQAKTVAFDTFKHLKDKVVIDSKAECSKDVVSEDSSIEIGLLDDGREVEGLSVFSGQKSLETNSDVYLREKYAKFVDSHLQASSSVVSDTTNQAPKLDDSGKMLQSLSVNHVLDEVVVPPHKILYESAGRRNIRLGFISFQIDLNEKKLSFLSRIAKKPEEDALREPFVPLTEEEEAEVSRAFSNYNRRKILVTHENSNIEITGQILQCLTPGAWLNDEVINLYFELLKEREKKEPKKFLKCHFFSTFFYKKLISGRNGYDFKAVKRWTTQRKIGYNLIECDKIFVPIHKEIHWCLAVINKKDKKFQYLDSLKGMDTQVLNVLARYFVDEVKDKTAEEINVSSWKQEYIDDLPNQQNGWDCGMFMIKYADFYSRGLELCFNQGHMPYFRRRTAKEILKLKAE